MENPLIQFLYRTCQFAQVIAILALLLLSAFAGFMFAPAHQEMVFSGALVLLTGVFLVLNRWRDNHPKKSIR